MAPVFSDPIFFRNWYYREGLFVPCTGMYYFPFYLHPAILDKISWVEGDILDVNGLMENLEGCNQIIHAAGMVSFVPADQNLFHINIEGTANLVNAAIEMGVTDFIHVSSVGPLGRQEDAIPIDEGKKWTGNKGQSNYGISKYFGEMEVWRGMGEGLRPLIVKSGYPAGLWRLESIQLRPV